jgi:hypothetical protein
MSSQLITKFLLILMFNLGAVSGFAQMPNPYGLPSCRPGAR